VNHSCPAIVRESILHFASRRAMNIEGLGEALVDQLLESGQVHGIPDLYSLSLEELEQLERMGRKSSENVLEEIDRSRSGDLSRLIFALGIRFVGERTAQILAESRGSMDNLAQASLEELMEIEDVGPKVAESVVFFFQQPGNQALIESLRTAGLNFSFTPASNTETRPLEGKVFVLTGSLQEMSRPQAKARIETLGGKVTSSLSARTDFLVVGTDPGSKLRAAQELGTIQLSEGEFLEMVSG
jgi:DNA ligase (NAD+)